ncbi:MAG TPA: hypothetical protein VK674_02745 [Candidatus Limnocylindria bacterium]|nr:hypothetical protein [Candidatus Limnocylindria bacterium]
MQLKHCKNELKSAETSLIRMRKAKTLDELEVEWKNYLAAIEKAWLKAEQECSAIRNRFQPWQGQYSRERRKDQLLRYLKHARNSDQHTIQALVETKPGKYEAKIQGSVYIDKLVVSKGQVVEYRGSKPLEVTVLPERVELMQVKDRGKWYNPPLTHKTTRLIWPDPIKVAELGLKYYQDFISEIEKDFGLPPTT